MSANSGFLLSTIGRKYFVALTAIFWSLFVMLHMLGNLLIFLGPEAYNKYSHALTANPFIYLIESVLLLFLLIHIIFAVSLKFRNMHTKPQNYAVSPVAAKSPAVSSQTMIYTGTIVLAFIIWHLITFKWGPEYSVNYNGVVMRDLDRLVFEKFHDPFYVVSYCVIMVLIGTHLYHGVKSIFQSLGMNHPRYNNFFKYFGYTYAIIVSAGFFSQPLYVYFLR